MERTDGGVASHPRAGAGGGSDTTDGSRSYSNWFFVVGTGRCGSSVFHEILARHDDVGFISNVEDRVATARPVGRWNNSLYRNIPAALTRKGRLRFAPSEAYRILDREVSPMLSRPSRDLGADDLTPWLTGRLRSSFERRADRQRAPTFSHKFTGWPRAGLLAEAFPGCRFVHVVRDGRAVANSFLQMDWWDGYRGPDHWRYGPLPAAYEELWEQNDRDFTVLAGLTWRLLMDAYVAAEQKISPERWLTIRYEDVVADPRHGFERILDHVGLSWSRRFEAGLDRHALRATRTQGFRRDLGDDKVERLDHCLRPMLERFDYR